MEDARYKAALKDGNVPALMGTFLSGLAGSGNPLEDPHKEGGYAQINHDAGT